MNSGDIVYSCGDGHCVRVIFKKRVSPSACAVELDGDEYWVDCDSLQESCDAVVSNDGLLEGKRVLVRFKDENTDVIRMWPATTKAVHSNGNASVCLDGMGGRVTVNADNIVPLSTMLPNED